MRRLVIMLAALAAGLLLPAGAAQATVSAAALGAQPAGVQSAPADDDGGWPWLWGDHEDDEDDDEDDENNEGDFLDGYDQDDIDADILNDLL